ncbi:hypothetical protein [Oceanisphaera psychrotolerans]|uniref:KfrA N-terminal DNA-binding domain-containing protein n=1 Tax=Oceanisphaera psychrotolerans TaxID=1414654 RepID=A0A1J4QDU3_9GAMM|nr:hypothetical protein [Oceanisphaera psychrotolerans]OIN07644.1 hypothetical protein BFR47_03250 [Oceanisphaera psychrotolerans]
MSQQDIINAIHSLVREGKSISTAAVKARLGGPVNMAQLLQLISRYKQSPDSLPPAESAAPAIEPQAETDLAGRVAELEARVARLETLLAQSAARSPEQQG